MKCQEPIFFDSRWWESYWRRIELSKLLKDLEGK